MEAVESLTPQPSPKEKPGTRKWEEFSPEYRAYRLERLKGRAPRSSKKEMSPSALVASPQDLARMLNISLASVYRRHSGGSLPKPIRIGKTLVWRISEIRDWVEAGAPSQSKWESIKAGIKTSR